MATPGSMERLGGVLRKLAALRSLKDRILVKGIHVDFEVDKTKARSGTHLESGDAEGVCNRLQKEANRLTQEPATDYVALASRTVEEQLVEEARGLVEEAMAELYSVMGPPSVSVKIGPLDVEKVAAMLSSDANNQIVALERGEKPFVGRVRDLIELAEIGWGVIANAGGGNWSGETAEWQVAAHGYRERFHKLIGVTKAREPEIPDVQAGVIYVSGSAVVGIGEA